MLKKHIKFTHTNFVAPNFLFDVFLIKISAEDVLSASGHEVRQLTVSTDKMFPKVDAMQRHLVTVST